MRKLYLHSVSFTFKFKGMLEFIVTFLAQMVTFTVKLYKENISIPFDYDTNFKKWVLNWQNECVHESKCFQG